MELRHLRYFVAVAETLSFTRAAERLHTSQPSLSQQIRHMEAELGTLLFARTRRSVQLTPAGLQFFSEAKGALLRVEEALASVRSPRAGRRRLVVGFLMSVEGNLLHRLLPEVQRRIPDQELELHCMTTPEQLAALASGEIDVGFLRLPQDDPRLHFDRVLDEVIHLVVPDTHSLASRDGVTAKDLDGLPFIAAAAPDAGTLQGVVDRWASEAGIHLAVTGQAGTVTGYMALVRLGRGIGLLPEFATTMLLPGLVHRPVEDPARIGLGMAFLAGSQPLEVRQFARVVRAVVRS